MRYTGLSRIYRSPQERRPKHRKTPTLDFLIQWVWRPFLRKRILYLANTDTDYLSDSVFHGLRLLFGADVIDFPKADRMYKSVSKDLISSRRGHGFTLYGTLEDLHVERPSSVTPEYAATFDLVVVADIWRQVELFRLLRLALHEKNAIILDGSDVPSLYKYAGTYWRDSKLCNVPSTDGIPYFKRELMPETLVYRSYMLLPKNLARRLMCFAPYLRTAFGVPPEKIIDHAPVKDKLMGSHIVDPEVAAHFAGATTGYAFNTEEGYYNDLQRSRFAITTKRAGWDCLRHYEIAANACVPCFRDLKSKSDYCAPHGLNETNCVIYTGLADLLLQIENMSEEKYSALQAGALAWAHSNSTVMRAVETLTQSGHSNFLLNADVQHLSIR